MKARFVYWTGRDRGGYCLVSLLIVWGGMSNSFFAGGFGFTFLVSAVI
jgi:hypothetical protein